MIIYMTQHLPNPRRSGIHLQRHHIPIVDTLARHVGTMVIESIAMHVEYVRRCAKSVDVLDGFVVGAHLEWRQV